MQRKKLIYLGTRVSRVELSGPNCTSSFSASEVQNSNMDTIDKAIRHLLAKDDTSLIEDLTAAASFSQSQFLFDLHEPRVCLKVSILFSVECVRITFH